MSTNATALTLRSAILVSIGLAIGTVAFNVPDSAGYDLPNKRVMAGMRGSNQDYLVQGQLRCEDVQTIPGVVGKNGCLQENIECVYDCGISNPPGMKVSSSWNPLRRMTYTGNITCGGDRLIGDCTYAAGGYYCDVGFSYIDGECGNTVPQYYPQWP